jgi:tRNA modification GTPase
MSRTHRRIDGDPAGRNNKRRLSRFTLRPPGGTSISCRAVTARTDTIAAIATAPGDGGISIVRVSGPDSLAVADRVFHCRGRPPSQREANTFAHGFVRSAAEGGGGDIADEAVLLIFRAPHSYTREDAVELQGHGGRACAGRILMAVLAAGARPAEPGEFTRRAFLNGRIDLVQAEAVADLVRARTDRAATAALDQLRGGLSREFTAIYGGLTAAAADVESRLDFSEDELDEHVGAGTVAGLRECAARLGRLLAGWDEGRMLREGVAAVIAGRPNAGKSTLMNALLGSDRVIVAPAPGTTRDAVEEETVLGGIAVRLVDTAGLRDTGCPVERESVRRALGRIENADLVLYVVDGSQPAHPEDAGNLRMLEAKKSILVLNKADIGAAQACVEAATAVRCSALTGQGLDDLRRAMVEALGVPGAHTCNATISERHRLFGQYALNELNEALALLCSGTSAFCVPAADCLRRAAEHIGAITGQNFSSDILDQIFCKFCIGK